MPNEFVTWAGDPAANVMPINDYLAPAFTTRLLGYVTGTASSTEANRTWRQSSLIAATIGQFVFDEVALDMLDDGTPAGMTALQNHFRSAIASVATSVIPTDQWLPITGGVLTGPLGLDAGVGLNAAITMRRDAGQYAIIQSDTGGLARWQILPGDNEPETGGNAGSNFDITRFDDAGSYIDTPLSINRATGVVNFTKPPTVNGDLLPYLPLAGGNLYGRMGAGGTGIAYIGVGWSNYLAFGWNATHVTAAVDGTYIGELATMADVAAAGGAFLPLAGGTVDNYLGSTGPFVCDAWAHFRSSVAFGNLSDFINFYGAPNRFRQWASNWYDYWNESNGARVWHSGDGPNLIMDRAANLYTDGIMRASGGRVMSLHSSVPPSVSAWATYLGQATGFWCVDDGMWFGNVDGAGNPIVGRMRLDYNSNLWVAAGIVAVGNMYASQSLSFHDSTGTALWGETNGGAWRIMGAYPQFQQLGIRGWGSGLTYNTQTRPDGGGAWTLDINGNSAQAGQCVATAYPGWSDASLKTKVVPWTTGLAAIRRIKPVSYEWSPDAPFGAPGVKHYGVTAQEIRAALPEAVVSVKHVTSKPFIPGEPAGEEESIELLAVEASTVFYACLNAINEIATRLEALEARDV